MKRKIFVAAVTWVPVLLLAGCHHRAKTTAHNAPEERPDWSSGYVKHHPAPSQSAEARPAAPPPLPSGAPKESDLRGKPVLVETGMASWYGPQYNRHKAADGTVYDQTAMTAAHRTLPLGSLARVTNVSTGESVIVRITDRGPFVRGRVLDLSQGAAKQIGVYRMGVAKVKVEAWNPPVESAAAASGGWWCVQTGAFTTERDAMDLRNALVKRYATAKVQEFQGPTGFWVRIDPAGRSEQQARVMQDWIGKPDDRADAYLVRLD
ncbi:MAG: septal ring lytic transglycosylase RlpA family protein [Acidobacteriaceae bacterium]|nr:septal ring lytic transglycosylase RlpA family protein [Acidobacteriaceae bacterium]